MKDPTGLSDDEVVKAALLKLGGPKARSDEALAACKHKKPTRDSLAGEIGAWTDDKPTCKAYGDSMHYGFRCIRCNIWLCERCKAVYRRT